jgi:hypothetical protein
MAWDSSVRVRMRYMRRRSRAEMPSKLVLGMGSLAEIAGSLGLGRRVGRGSVTWGSTPNLNAFA